MYNEASSAQQTGKRGDTRFKYMTLTSEGTLSPPSPDPAIGEARKLARFVAKITQAQLMAPAWVPDFASHPKGFDLNGSWASSGLHILDFTPALSSHYTTEPQAPTTRRNLKLTSNAALSMSFPGRSRRRMRASIVRVNRCRFPTWSRMGPGRSHADSLPVAHR
jgi:hypothetical protein